MHGNGQRSEGAAGHGSTGFEERVRAALAEAGELLDTPAEVAVGALDEASLSATLEAAADLLAEQLRTADGSRLVELSIAALEIERLRGEDLRRGQDRRLLGLRGVQEALGALHAVSNTEQLYALATEGLCSKCGFDRAILFGIQGSELVPQSVRFNQDPDWAEEILALGRSKQGRPQLDELILETEMLRRRAPAIVSDAQHDPRATEPLVSATRTRSYVAAPIMPEGRVIGFLHADCYHSDRAVDEIDRDILWAFAEGYGYALERTFLRVHLVEQRQQLEELLASASALAGEICQAEVALERTGQGALAATSRAGAQLAAPGNGPGAALTPREREVLDLMVGGETNAEIARRLFIAESTAKAHVKHILRKLGASNRADAVSRFLRQTSPEGSAEPIISDYQSTPFG